MASLSRKAPVLLSGILVLGLLLFLIEKRRLRLEIESAGDERQQEIARLIEEGRDLRNAAIESNTNESGEIRSVPAPTLKVAGTRLTSQLLNEGAMGRFAWVATRGNSITDELLSIAAVLGLSELDTRHLQEAAEAARQEIAAITLARADVRIIRDGILPDPPPAREVFQQLVDAASPDRKLALYADRQARQLLGQRQKLLAIETQDWPEARASYERLQTEFRNIMGDDGYAYYEALGAATIIEDRFMDLGLGRQYLLVTRDASGTRPYQIHEMRIRTGPYQFATRVGGGGIVGGGGSGPRPGSVSVGSHSEGARTAKEMRDKMDLLVPLIPEDF